MILCLLAWGASACPTGGYQWVYVRLCFVMDDAGTGFEPVTFRL
ncbi:MAG: hypothetical protein RIS83_14 [Pseudomonadota bacterium]